MKSLSLKKLNEFSMDKKSQIKVFAGACEAAEAEAGKKKTKRKWWSCTSTCSAYCG